MKQLLKVGLISGALAWNSVTIEAREFTSSTGQKIEAEIMSVVGSTVSLKRSNGNVVGVPMDRFSEADRKFILEWKEANKGKVPAHLKNKMPRMDMKVSNGKRSKDDDQISGFVDERKQKLQMSVTMENNDAVYPIEDANLTILVLARSPETGEDAVVQRDHFKDIDLPLSEEKTYQGRSFELWYDDIGAMYGHKYKGYIVFLEDPEGKILAEATIPGAAAKYLANAKGLKAGDVYDRTYKRRATVSLRDSVKGMMPAKK